MTHYIAITNEKGNKGQVIGNTKNGAFKGMSLEQFIQALKNTTCYSFEVKAI